MELSSLPTLNAVLNESRVPQDAADQIQTPTETGDRALCVRLRDPRQSDAHR